MKYIQEIRIENFQSHQDTTIKLTDGLNLLIGTSDVGKSAILRALNLVFHNIPQRGVKGILRKDETELRVTVTWNDGSFCQRIRGDRNAVIFQKAGSDVEVYDGFDTTVPDAFLEFLGNPPLDYKNEPISYAPQGGRMFLVDLTPTELPRAISDLMGVYDLEEVANVLSSKRISRNKEATKLDQQIVDLQKQLTDTLDPLPLLNECDRIDKIIDYIESNEFKKEKMYSLLQQHDHAVQEYEQYYKSHSQVNENLKIQHYVDELMCLYEFASVAAPYLEQHAHLENDIQKVQAMVDKFHYNNDFQHVLKILQEHYELANKYENILNKYNEYCNQYKTYHSEYKEYNNIYKTLTKEHDKLIASLREMNILCETCKQVIF